MGTSTPARPNAWSRRLDLDPVVGEQRPLVVLLGDTTEVGEHDRDADDGDDQPDQRQPAVALGVNSVDDAVGVAPSGDGRGNRGHRAHRGLSVWTGVRLRNTRRLGQRGHERRPGTRRDRPELTVPPIAPSTASATRRDGTGEPSRRTAAGEVGLFDLRDQRRGRGLVGVIGLARGGCSIAARAAGPRRRPSRPRPRAAPGHTRTTDSGAADGRQERRGGDGTGAVCGQARRIGGIDRVDRFWWARPGAVARRRRGPDLRPRLCGRGGERRRERHEASRYCGLARAGEVPDPAGQHGLRVGAGGARLVEQRLGGQRRARRT